MSEPEIRWSTFSGIRVRESCWHPGTDNERSIYEMQQRCLQCGREWWTEYDPRKPQRVPCDNCAAHQRQAEQEARQQQTEGEQAGKVILLGCGLFFVGVFFVLPLAGMLINWLRGR